MKYEKGSFIQVPNKNIMKGLPPQTQVVFMWICNFADNEGICFPSISTLQDCSGCSKNTILRSIKKLEKIGIIKKTNRIINNEKQANLYQILLLGGSATRELGGATQALGSATREPGGSATREHRTISTLLTQTINYSFEEFWKTFPHARTGSKKKSEVEYKKLNKTKLIQECILLQMKSFTDPRGYSFTPACQRRLQNYTPKNENLIDTQLYEYIKRLKSGEADGPKREEYGKLATKNFTTEQIKKAELRVRNEKRTKFIWKP